ncbi:MAG TPA: hypothetical protein VJG65_00740 [Patescibacteria group bacterium]|nr:hypothetical protein [Patescibacteria group bacterium]
MSKPNNDNQHSATLDEVLSTIINFADKTEERFDNLENDISDMKGEISGMKGEISGMKGEIGQIKATMVTKDYLDDKLSDLRGDLVVMLRKGDAKLKVLAEMLHDKKVLNRADVKRIYSLEPFAQQFQN